MSRTLETRHVSVSINRAAGEVYISMSNGESLIHWATGLGDRYERRGDDWLVHGPDGVVTARLPKPNEFGVVGHVEKDLTTLKSVLEGR